jgi:trigger factor
MTENIQENVISKLPTLPVVVSDDNVAKVSISAEEHELEPYKKQYIKEKRKNVVLRGFRKGNAPEAMVAHYFKDEARQSARDNVVYVKYMQLLQEHKLQPLSMPKVEEMKDQNGKIDAKITVEVLQPVLLGQYLGLEIEKMPSKSVDDALKSTLNEIKQTYPKFVDTTDGIAQENSVIVADYCIVDGDKELEKQEGFNIRLGAGLYYKDFEDNVLGIKVGETKEFDVQFPETYHREEFRNKKPHFIFMAKEVKDVKEYADEELAKVLSYDNEQVMKDSLTQEIKIKYQEESRLYYENQVLGKLLESHKFKIPQKLIDAEIATIRAEKPDMSMEQIGEVSERFVRTDLILHSICERHPDIQLKQEEFDAKVAELASRANENIEATLKKLQDAGKMQTYINYLANCKVVNFLIENADIKELEQQTLLPENIETNTLIDINTEEKENG